MHPQRLATAAVLVLLILSVVVRVRNLSSPLTEDHVFRQTQTAITVWNFATEGIHPLAYEMPVFGPPWRMPIEFPIFQIVAAFLVKIGFDNIDLACRLTNLAFFYLSAALLYLLCRLHFDSRGAAVCILLAYVWTPFTIFWSRTAMIDYAAVAFALAYLYGFARWMERRRWPAWLLATGAGSLLLLTKPTTLPIVGFALVWLAWRHRQRWHEWLPGSIVAVVIPTLIGAWWSAYADRVRRGSPATDWLTTSVLSGWSVGALSQRLEWHNWALILHRIGDTFLPAGLAIFLVLGLWHGLRTRAAGGAFVLVMALGACATIAIFFNLYREHNYYLIAVSPAVAVVAGYGFHWLWELVRYEVARWALAIATLLFWQWHAQSYLAPAFSVAYDNDLSYRVGRAIAEVTTPDERVIVEDHDWSPDYLYYAQRKGLMWGGIADLAAEPRKRLVRSDNFTTIVCLAREPAAAQFWPHHELVRRVGPVSIYRVSE